MYFKAKDTILKSKNLTTDHNIAVKKFKNDNTSLIEGLTKFKDKTLTSKKWIADQGIELGKISDHNKSSRKELKKPQNNLRIFKRNMIKGWKELGKKMIQKLKN